MSVDGLLVERPHSNGTAKQIELVQLISELQGHDFSEAHLLLVADDCIGLLISPDRLLIHFPRMLFSFG